MILRELKLMTTEHKDYIGAKIGMWLFLFTEILLFGGLFILYSVYLSRYADFFHKAGKDLNVIIGTIITLILITSSFAIAASITALQKGDKVKSIIAVTFTILCAFSFLVNKFFEWTAKFEHGIYPNSTKLLELPKGEITFYNLYYVMTGLHAFHVFVGIVLLSIVLFFIQSDKINKDNFITLENSALYWHIVDLIWIFLYPLFYLIV
jgi:cytochrome c oxidase subunit 3